VDATHAGQGYLALPDAGSGPGVLVLHSWWGLTPFFKDLCDRLAAEGFVALAPDLLDGHTPTSAEEAEAQLQGADANTLAHLTRSSLHTLRELPVTEDRAVGVVGFSMGGSLALWLSARVPQAIAATCAFYAGQDIDFVDASSAYLGHYAEDDAYVDEDGLVLLEADLHLLGLDTTFHRYPGTRHWFFEADRPEHDPEAAGLAWGRTVAFLHAHLDADADADA
jgi:carboxymethylenebutenolidase